VSTAGDLRRGAIVAGARPAPGSVPDPGRAARLGRRVCLSTLVVAVVAAYLAWRGWQELSEFGPARAVRAGRWELAGPAADQRPPPVRAMQPISPRPRRPR
jgi:hypothetical protein